MGWCKFGHLDLAEKKVRIQQKFEHLTTYNPISKEKKEKRSLSEGDASQRDLEKDDVLPSWCDLRKNLEAISNHSVRRHGELLLTSFIS